MQYDRKTIRRKIVPIVILPFLDLTIFIFRMLPLSWIRNFATFVGRRVYRLARRSRERALSNLNRVYGQEKTPEEIETMAQCVFTEVIKSFFDYVACSKVTSKERFFSLVEVQGEEHLKAAYQQGKGVICLVPHLSSWEFAAITPPMLGYETSAASKAMKMKMLEKRMVRFRQRRGMKNITREGSYQKLLEVLGKGECLIMMIDQDTKVKGVFVDFMGIPAYTPLGASRLAMETGALVVPMVMTRKEDNNYRFIIHPQLPVIKTGDWEMDLYENTRRQTQVMEQIIRTYPAQWVWMHARWQRTPETIAAYRKWKEEQARQAAASPIIN